MTLGEFRKLTEGMPDDTPLLGKAPDSSHALYVMKANRATVDHVPGMSHSDWWKGSIDIPEEYKREGIVLT